MKTLAEVSEELERRLANIFLRYENGKRAVFGDCELFNSDPHWRDLIPFHEYFHGDTGRGLQPSNRLDRDHCPNIDWNSPRNTLYILKPGECRLLRSAAEYFGAVVSRHGFEG